MLESEKELYYQVGRFDVTGIFQCLAGKSELTDIVGGFTFPFSEYFDIDNVRIWCPTYTIAEQNGDETILIMLNVRKEETSIQTPISDTLSYPVVANKNCVYNEITEVFGDSQRSPKPKYISGCSVNHGVVVRVAGNKYIRKGTSIRDYQSIEALTKPKTFIDRVKEITKPKAI